MNLLAPFGLALGLLSLPIIAMYFLKLRRKRIIVPSTLLWQVVQKSERAARPFDKFRRNFLLVLQLLLLAALTAALARPFMQTEATTHSSVVIVIDTSASMGATDTAQGTRLKAALDGAREVVDAMAAGDETMVVVAGPRTEVRLPFTRDPNAVRAALNDIEITSAEGSLRQGLQLALSMAKSRSDVSVVVLSDGGGETLDDLPAGNVEFRYIPVGSSADNCGIIAIDLRRSPANDLDRQLFVTIQNFGTRDSEAEIKVYLDDKLLGLRNETIATDTPLSLVFDMGTTHAGVLRVQLHAENDHLPADDQAWALIGEVAERRVLLVGGDWLTARALAGDPRVSLTTVTTSEFSPNMLAQHDATVFGGTVPPDVDGHSYLVIGPHKGSPVTFTPAYKAPRVLGWRRTHPTLRFVEWSGVSIARAHGVKSAGGLIPIVNSDGGPLVLAGERSGARVVQLTFDPLESDLPLRVGWPVFLLNTVGWLTDGIGGNQGSQQLPSGTAYVRRAPDGVTTADVRVTAPDGSSVSAQVNGGLIRIRDTTQTGIYRVKAGGTVDAFASNLLSQRESKITPQSTLNMSNTAIVATQASMVGRQELWREFLLLALFLLCLEWVYWHRRRIG